MNIIDQGLVTLHLFRHPIQPDQPHPFRLLYPAKPLRIGLCWINVDQRQSINVIDRFIRFIIQFSQINHINLHFFIQLNQLQVGLLVG